MNKEVQIGEVEGCEELSEARRRMIDHALGVEDLSAVEFPGMYAGLVGPEETEEVQREMLTAPAADVLVVLGLLRRVGLKHPRLAAPLRHGLGMADLVQIAKERGAWREPTRDLPKPGDVVIVAQGSLVEHAFTVMGIRYGLGGLGSVLSIDGGQHDERGLVRRLKAIRRRARTWAIEFTSVRAVIWDAVHSAGEEELLPGSAPVRRVSGWVDLDAMFAGT